MISHIFKIFLFFLMLMYSKQTFCQNQTDTLSPILPGSELPFKISIQQANFSLPSGLQSYVSAIDEGKWLLLTGRTNGLHDFNNDNNNFPPNKQNVVVYVVDPQTGSLWSKSLADPSSGLSQSQIDLLSVTSAQSYQNDDTLYVVGGYGVDSATGLFSTKSSLTAIDIPGLMHWVVHPSSGETAAQHIRQIFHPLLQVTGGFMSQVDSHKPTLLIFGQNFKGFYLPSSNGDYTEQVRCFRIIDNGEQLYVLPLPSEDPNPNYRRRDLNVVPIIKKGSSSYEQAFVALSGVFTLEGGAWTVPVEISATGKTFMADPTSPFAFKQGMNNYACPTIGLFSRKSNDMYIVVLGGISYEFFSGNVLMSDPDLPFINQVTTIQIDKHDHYQQYIMEGQYPVILSTGPHPGNPLLFGAGAQFFPADNLSAYSNGVFQLDKFKGSRVLLGYIVGGIQSTLPDTLVSTDSAASPYIFSVFLEPQSPI